MEALALSCWALLGLLGVVLRVVVQWRRTGSTGFRGFGAGPLDRAAGLLFVGGIALGVAGPAVYDATDDVWPLGLALFVAGLGAMVGAQFAMGASWRVGVDPAERTQLVTDGPFRIVRNPIFSAMLPAQLGIVLISPSALAIAGWVVAILGLELQVRFVEEPYLLRTHGDPYREYGRRVGRFVPGIGRFD